MFKKTNIQSGILQSFLVQTEITRIYLKDGETLDIFYEFGPHAYTLINFSAESIIFRMDVNRFKSI